MRRIALNLTSATVEKVGSSFRLHTRSGPAGNFWAGIHFLLFYVKLFLDITMLLEQKGYWLGNCRSLVFCRSLLAAPIHIYSNLGW